MRYLLGLLLLVTMVCSAAPQRNVLLLISDDQGLDAGCYGNPIVRTPNIDRLASEGMLFTQGYAAVSSCSPSRSVLYTGMYNHANGQYGLAHAAHNQRTRPEVRTLPAILNEQGYVTGVIGKEHVETRETYPFHKRPPVANRRPPALRKATAEFLQSLGEKPFFLVVGFGDTHRPFPPNPPERLSSTTAAQLRLPDFLPDVPDVRRDYANYIASVDSLDRCVGAVLGALSDAGKTTSTLIIFVSDNGIPFPGAKTNLYDPGIHLPMIVSMPDASRETTSTNAMMSWIDVAPTILDFTGAPGAEAMHGRSVLPLFADPDAPGWDRIFASHTFHEITMYYPMRCVRTRDYKLIWNLAYQLPYPIAGDLLGSPTWKAMQGDPQQRVGQRTMQQYLHRPEFELYDLRNDSGELHNIADKPESAEKLKELKTQINEMMRKTKDPWL